MSLFLLVLGLFYPQMSSGKALENVRVVGILKERTRRAEFQGSQGFLGSVCCKRNYAKKINRRHCSIDHDQPEQRGIAMISWREMVD